MCNNEGGTSPGGCVDGALDLIFCGRVNGRGRIIQYQNTRIGEECSRQCQPLTLPAGEGHPTLANDGLVPFGEPADELVCLGGFCRSDHLFAGGTGLSKGNIVSDRA
ncbi:hypothetical protein SDC9_164457 [bioreactor metagenome]|uniref:Uncharacterized protein n=1 Tax=bioreactor metagenome TaxID=1076179 RepID=A0A645FRP8_9ZZZZ